MSKLGSYSFLSLTLTARKIGTLFVSCRRRTGMQWILQQLWPDEPTVGHLHMCVRTPSFPTTAKIGNNWVKLVLLNAFRAACVLRSHIYEDTNKFSALDRRSLPVI